jgi:hypothetical protein
VALRRSRSNSLSSLLHAEEENDRPPAPYPGAAAANATKRRGASGGQARGRIQRGYLRLPLGGAGRCRACACDKADSAPPRLRAARDGYDNPEVLKLRRMSVLLVEELTRCRRCHTPRTRVEGPGCGCGGGHKRRRPRCCRWC